MTAPLDLRAVEAQESAGVCCNCGYSGTEETPCLKRGDKTHCEHWWDGSDDHDLPLLKTEAALRAFAYTGSDGMQTLVRQLYRAFRHTRDERDALLAHCRSLRAALKKAEYWIGWHPETQERIDECDAARDQIAAVLAQATDQEET